MVAHELTHVIQHYRRGGPGWLVEGVADYVRYYVIEPGTRRGRFDPQRSDYKRGYQPAAGLLNWLESRRPGLVIGLNAAMRRASVCARANSSSLGTTATTAPSAIISAPERRWPVKYIHRTIG